MPPRRFHHPVRIILVAAIAAPLFAAPIVEARQDPVPLDERVADRGPLSMSLREVSLDLRLPSSFDRIYRLPGATDRYMRIDGALHAVFPRSEYVRITSRRASVVLPSIPAGTVFYIGAPPPADGIYSAPGPATPDPRAEAADVSSAMLPAGPPSVYATRLHAVPGRFEGPAPRIEMTAAPATIVTDAEYRAERLRVLMRQAAGASGG